MTAKRNSVNINDFLPAAVKEELAKSFLGQFLSVPAPTKRRASQSEEGKNGDDHQVQVEVDVTDSCSPEVAEDDFQEEALKVTALAEQRRMRRQCETPSQKRHNRKLRAQSFVSTTSNNQGDAMMAAVIPFSNLATESFDDDDSDHEPTERSNIAESFADASHNSTSSKNDESFWNLRTDCMVPDDFPSSHHSMRNSSNNKNNNNKGQRRSSCAADRLSASIASGMDMRGGSGHMSNSSRRSRTDGSKRGRRSTTSNMSVSEHRGSERRRNSQQSTSWQRHQSAHSETSRKSTNSSSSHHQRPPRGGGGYRRSSTTSSIMSNSYHEPATPRSSKRNSRTSDSLMSPRSRASTHSRTSRRSTTSANHNKSPRKKQHRRRGSTGSKQDDLETSLAALMPFPPEEEYDGPPTQPERKESAHSRSIKASPLPPRKSSKSSTKSNKSNSSNKFRSSPSSSKGRRPLQDTFDDQEAWMGLPFSPTDMDIDIQSVATMSIDALDLEDGGQSRRKNNNNKKGKKKKISFGSVMKEEEEETDKRSRRNNKRESGMDFWDSRLESDSVSRMMDSIAW